MSIKDNDGEVRYCVTAILDLLGFSNHLEIASNDIRTRIGQEAISRLQVLEDALQLMVEELKTGSQEYPEPGSYHHIRINDALIFTIDLPDILRPSVGKSVWTGIAPNDIEKFFDIDSFEHDEDYPAALQARLSGEVAQLVRFVGMMARFHSFINRKENSAYFPGARTIIASGYRRPFDMQRVEDFLSANFSVSNAYRAEKHLHGPRFYVENNVSQMLCMNRFARNLLRFACFTTRPTLFDPFDEHEDNFYHSGERVLTKPADVALFRKPFTFRELDPDPLCYLQIMPRLSPYLESAEQPARGGNRLGGSIARKVLKAIISGPQAMENGYSSLGGWRGMDLESDIRFFAELIESGDSPTLKRKIDEERRRNPMLNPLRS